MKFLPLSIIFLLNSYSFAKQSCRSVLETHSIEASNTSLRRIVSKNLSKFGDAKWRDSYYQDLLHIKLAADIFFGHMQRAGLSNYDLISNTMTTRGPRDTFSSYSLFLSAFDSLSVNELNHYVGILQPEISVYSLFQNATQNIVKSRTLYPRQKRVLLRQLLTVLDSNKFDVENLKVNLEIIALVDSYKEN